jgi:hypothetical protein
MASRFEVRTAKRLTIQLLITELISILLLGAKSGHWLAGLIAPLWGIVIVPLVLFSFDRPLHYEILPFGLFVAVCFFVTILSVFRHVPRVVGHISLLIYNVLSFLLLLGLCHRALKTSQLGAPENQPP